MDSKIIFGYWQMQGIAEPERYLLEYLQLPYTEKTYYYETNREEWIQDKNKLGLDFPNLPYVIDGDFNLTESTAIMKWLPIKAKNSTLLGCNERDQILVTTILGVLSDLFLPHFYNICNAPKEKWKEVRDEIFEKYFVSKLNYLSKFVGNKEWALGYLTIADFQLAFILDWVNLADPEFLKKWKNLVDLHGRFFSLENIKKYVESGKRSKGLFSKSSTWPSY